MKKLILLTLLIAFGLRSGAQTATLALITAPCDSNGVVVATFSGCDIPFQVTWNTPFSTFAGPETTGVTDTFRGYTGGPLYMFVLGSTVGGTTYAFSDTADFSPPFTVTDSAAGGICPFGTLHATVIGGTGPFTYKWEDATTYSVVGTTNPASVPFGSYIVRVTDLGTGCVSGFATHPIEVMVNPTFHDSVVSTSGICPVPTIATVYPVGGGTPPFTYIWSYIPSFGITDIISTAATATLTGAAAPVAPGLFLYFQQTTDALGCMYTFCMTATYDPGFNGSVTTTTADCTNGTASVTVTGTTGPYSYLWSNGATTPSISGLTTGTYNVKITNALGCVDSSVIDSGLSGYVPQAITIGAPGVTTPATCVDSNGSITAFGSGGTPPYTYLWSNGGTTATISGLSSNYYDVTVTDANGCIGWGSDYVGSSTPISVTYVATPSSCTSPTGTASLTISGGTAPYTITWYTSPAQTGTTASGLPAGTYHFYITDALGCTQSGAVTIPPIDVIYLSFSSSPATCLAADGAVSVSASGGFAPYTYSWNTGSTAPNLAGVPYGTYYATVTDAHGCAVTNCQQVPYSSPLELGLATTPASCLYTHDGIIRATASLGTPPYSYSMGGSASGAVTVPGLATGPYWVYVSDALGCNAWQYTYVDYDVTDSSCFCVVKGTVYDDLNHNCIQDPGEPGIQNIQLQSSGFGYTYTDSSGNYDFLLPSGGYTLSQTVLSIYPLSPCQTNNIAYTSVAAVGCSATYNFGDTLDPIHDVHICTWDYAKPRPGFSYTQTTVITNNGTLTEPNILASYNPDGQIYGPSFVPYGVFSGAPYNYLTQDSALSLAPGAGQEFLTTYNVPADVPLGTNVVFKDTVAYKPPVSNWLNDYSPWNNVDYFTTITVGSYDPNFIEVSPKGTGTAGDITTSDSILEYMIHFQNTGSYMAEKVVVTDTLDANLDWTTLRPDYMSDKCAVTINEHGVATFTFNNIDLPASSSEPVTSNAMFTYTVKLRPGLSIGTQIKNHASIYFDFNQPVITDTVLNTISWPASVASIPGVSGNNSFTIYPNPAENTFNAIINLDASGAYNLKVCDVTGKTAISKTLSLQKGSQTITVDASHLVPGVYFVTFSGNGSAEQTQKLVIMK